MITEQTQIYTNIGTIIALIIAIVGFAVKITSIKDNQNFRITNLEEKCKNAEAELAILRSKANNTDLAIAKIDTKLDNMNNILLEIKKKMV